MVTTRRNSDDDVPNFEAMIAAAVANALPNLTAALRTQITNDIRNGAESSGGSGGGGDAVPNGIHVWIERFNKLKPLAFRSAATPAEAEDWITHMEKLFQVLGVIRQLQDRRIFRHHEQQRYEVSMGPDLSVDLRELWGATWRGCWLPPVNNELLHESEIRNKRDRDVNRILEQGTGPTGEQGYRYELGFFGVEDQRFARLGMEMSSRVRATGGCFTCGSTQHKVKDCPQGKQRQSMPADFARLPPTTGRVYATTRDQAAKTSETYRTPTPLIERIIISTPMKNHILIDHEYVNCHLRFDDRIRSANLLPIHMFDFDVILGMDWLASHRCYIDALFSGSVHGQHLLESPNIENLLLFCEFADAPVELKELKSSYKRLMENGFIRPSVSPCVHSGLIGMKKWGAALVYDYANSNRYYDYGIIYRDPSMFEAITKWTRLTTVTEVRSFSGACWLLPTESFEEELKRIGVCSDIDFPSSSWWFSDIQIKEALRVDGELWPLLHNVETVKLNIRGASGFCYSRWMIPMWKWDEIFHGVRYGLPTIRNDIDAFWVVVDRLTKLLIFTYSDRTMVLSMLAEIFRQKAWGTRLKFSTFNFFLQTAGQSGEDHIQTLEDMLRACAFGIGQAAPFELLYGRKCRAPICWDEVGERLIEGPELIEITNEKVVVAKEKLKEARSRQKSYADKHRRDLEFSSCEIVVFTEVSL
ncbi:putative reverse transcriptase domain-containing protein [Tanacetum coccineum]